MQKWNHAWLHIIYDRERTNYESTKACSKMNYCQQSIDNEISRFFINDSQFANYRFN